MHFEFKELYKPANFPLKYSKNINKNFKYISKVWGEEGEGKEIEQGNLVNSDKE